MNEKRSYDLSFLKRISDNDETFILDMINTFRANAPNYLSKINNYFHEKDYRGIYNETHRFIPGTSFLGVKELENVLINIEELTKKMENIEELPELIFDVKNKIHNLLNQLSEDFNLK